jgi:hypothetical protein
VEGSISQLGSLVSSRVWPLLALLVSLRPAHRLSMLACNRQSASQEADAHACSHVLQTLMLMMLYLLPPVLPRPNHPPTHSQSNILSMLPTPGLTLPRLLSLPASKLR